jgi:type II secretion system protein N
LSVDLRRWFKGLSWSFLWVLLFWTFLVIGLPTEAAKGWLAERLGHGFDAKVSIEELDIGWNLGIILKGVSLTSQASAMRLEWLKVQPRLSSLISVKPEMDFSGGTSSGGHLSGSYHSGELSLSFKDISFKDFSTATLPVPSSATMSGSGRLKFVTGNGTIDTEVDGVPGGKQRLRIPAGEGLGLDGKLKITVSLPKL